MAARWLTEPLARWVGVVAAHGWATLGVIALATLALAWAAVDRFRINSDLSDLIEQQADWREDFDRYEAAFPDAVRTSMIVVSGRSAKGVEDAAMAVEARVRARQDLFTAVYAPQNDAFFRDHALLFLDLDDLDDTVDRIARAQPILTAVAEDPSLRGILALIGDGVVNEPPEGFDTVIRLVADSGAAQLAGRDPGVAWTDELFQSDDMRHRLIFLKGRPNFAAPLPSARVMAELRALVAEVPVADGIRVRITGEIPLQHEEIEAALAGVQLAGWLSLGLLAAILVVGVRSAKIIAATFLLLAVGVVWTSGYAMLSVGEYNTLSIIFLVMFFGLGVDFALHFSLRYQEAVNRGDRDVVAALVETTRSVGGAIATCTATTSIGFLGFLPTQYQGLADLGVIAAGGMVVAAILTFALLPAFYAVVGPIRPHTIDLPTGDRLVSVLMRKRALVFGVLGVATLVACLSATGLHFDYSVLALKDQDSESMQTLRELQNDGVATDYSLVVLAPDPRAVDVLKELPTVDSVTTPWDYVPEDQDEKGYALEDLEALISSALSPARTRDAPTVAQLRGELSGLAALLRQQAVEGELARLSEVAEAMQERPDEELLAWQRGVVSNLLFELGWLRRALALESVEFEDLPRDLRARLVGADGQYLSVVTPSGNVADVEVLSDFVESVRERVPVATGRSVVEWGVGRIVVESFQQALLFSMLGILGVLLVVFRNLKDALLILVPLTLTAVFSMGICVALDLPLNMANILVLPLIFGLGVDNGIHVVDRFRAGPDVGRLMHSSTPRAVMLSTLTTIGAFSALAISPHQGTASVGMLLAISVALLLVFTVFVLPLLLSLMVVSNEQ